MTLLVGTRSVIYVGFLAAIIATVLSVLDGVAAGDLGGKTDDTLSVLTNVILLLPAVPLMIIITSTLNNVSDTLIAVIIGLTSWSWNARVLRAQTLSLRRRAFVEASRGRGESPWRITGFEGVRD